MKAERAALFKPHFEQARDKKLRLANLRRVMELKRGKFSSQREFIEEWNALSPEAQEKIERLIEPVKAEEKLD